MLVRQDRATASQAADGRKRLRLLVVDENPTARDVMARRLSHLGHDVTLAEDGFRALSLLQTRPMDIVLIDMDLLLLPVVTMMRKIRSSHIAPDACFVMIADRPDAPSAIAALDAGADDILVKPFDFDILDARLRHLSQRAEQMGALARYNAELDARIARRAVELGEARDALQDMEVDRARLISSITVLRAEIDRLQSART
ncbi:response regulator [Sphingobium sp.]|uniref:response regulator n=1 Tax=Sphingobium sp. TaxID=1912891 RepID=UPI0025FD962A|nr:response regulator [Sphingobium sp.]